MKIPLPEEPAAPIRERMGEAEVPGRAHQALWFALARRGVASVVLVPAREGLDVTGLAQSLVDVGRRLGDSPVTAIVPETIDYGFVTRTAALLATTRERKDRLPGSSPLEVVVAIHPVTAEPLGLALVQAADCVILCLDEGRTRVDAVKESLALIGPERVAGSVLIR